MSLALKRIKSRYKTAAVHNNFPFLPMTTYSLTPSTHNTLTPITHNTLQSLTIHSLHSQYTHSNHSQYTPFTHSTSSTHNTLQSLRSLHPTHIAFHACIDQVFQKTAFPLVMDLLRGQDTLLFTYGITNSGKTHTMQVRKFNEPQGARIHCTCPLPCTHARTSKRACAQLVHHSHSKNQLCTVTGFLNSATQGSEEELDGIMPRTLDVLFNSIHEQRAKWFTFKPDSAKGTIVVRVSQPSAPNETRRGKNAACNARRNKQAQ